MEKMRYVGVQMPPQFHEYLNLYAVAHKATKSRILRKALQDWYDKNNLLNQEQTLLNELGTRLQLEWNYEKRLLSDCARVDSYIAFKEKTLQRFIEKGLTKGQINAIIEGIKL